MEKIVVNAKAVQTLIDRETKKCIDAIKQNAKNGIATTDLYISKEVHSEVRDAIEKQLKESGTRFTWQTVLRGCNEYTGRPQSYPSEIIGDERHRRITILD